MHIVFKTCRAHTMHGAIVYSDVVIYVHVLALGVAAFVLGQVFDGSAA